ncbi:MAG: hypothetical protein RIS86_2155 [Planctomycetota bacterium]|jgi:hypothetical protein
MRIEPRDASRRRLPRVEVDERARPATVPLARDERERVHSAEGGASATLFLRWDEALDDARALRRCVVCGCDDLYVRKSLPQVTPFIVVLAFAGTAVALLGYAASPVAYALLAALLVVDVATLLLAERQLVCYACGAVYTRLRIARYHRRWDRSVAERAGREPPDLPGALAAPSRATEDGPGPEPVADTQGTSP